MFLGKVLPLPLSPKQRHVKNRQSFYVGALRV